MNLKNENAALLASLILRIGLAVVFLLFGLQKLYSSSQTTAEVQLLLDWSIANSAALNYYLGLTEIILALLFLIGFKIRIASLIASFLLVLFFSSFLAKYGLSINPQIYRDVGLLGASLALFFLGSGRWGLDIYFLEEQKENE